MATPDNRSKYKRTNLFLLRIWCDDADENKDEQENEQVDKGESSTCRQWHGMVQRTVSGEAQSFGEKDDLIEVLEAMIYRDRKDRLQDAGPRAKTGYEAALLPGGDDQTEKTRVNEEI